MTEQEKAMRLALEALEQIAAYRPLTFAECSDAEAVMGIAENAIPALRSALEQPAQDYTTTRNAWTGRATHKCNHCGRDDFRSEHAAKFHKCEALEQPAQDEPVLYQFQDRDGYWCDFATKKHYEATVADGSWPIRALYTRPQAREPLTDEQRSWIVATCVTPRQIIDLVEKMHGIKGEA